jgi:hypothetical protein
VIRLLSVVIACGFVAVIVACPRQLPLKADGCIDNQVCDHVTCCCVGLGEGSWFCCPTVISS